MNRQTLIVYFSLTYLISWLIWSPLVAAAQGWIDVNVTPFLYVLGFMGSLLSALIVTVGSLGLTGVRALLGGLGKVRVGLQWYAFVLLVPPLLFLAAALINYSVTGEWAALLQYGQLGDMFPGLGLVLTAIAHILIVGTGEEVGWRGFALPRLQNKHTALKSTLILAPLWGFWHLPTFLFDNDLLTGFGLAIFFTVLSIPIAIIYTWLYNSTGGSLFIVSLWSTSTTLAIGSSAAKGIIPIIISALLIIMAMLITNLTNTENLSRQAKVTLDQ